MDDLVARAKDLAHRAHAGQVDKAGRPYIEHVARVAAAARDPGCMNCPGCDEAEAVAWLHDVLEDGDADHGKAAMQFPGRIKYAVTLLTRCTDYDMAIYYGEIRQNPLALRVKLADIADNSDESRLALLPKDVADRLRRKYTRAREALHGEGR